MTQKLALNQKLNKLYTIYILKYWNLMTWAKP